jgi:hypothetical protein
VSVYPDHGQNHPRKARQKIPHSVRAKESKGRRQDTGKGAGEEAGQSRAQAGRKTANVVLNMAFGEHTMAVDTHVFRVGNRTGLAPGNSPLEVELGLEKVIPSEFMLHAHHWLILHGRYICLARKPRCDVCLINDLCRWPEKTV